MNEMLAEILKLKPSEIASTLAALLGRVATIVDRLDGDSTDLDEVKQVLATTQAYAEAAKQVLGGYSVEELAKHPPLFAGGSGRESLEADLLAEARGEGERYPAPAGPYPIPPPPPPARDDEG